MTWPVIIVGGILSGVFTATESAAVGCIYSAIVGFATKKMTLKKCWNVLYDSAVSVSKLKLIVGCATLFGWILSIQQFPAWIASTLIAFTDNKWIVLFLIIGILLIVGCFLETIAALGFRACSERTYAILFVKVNGAVAVEKATALGLFILNLEGLQTKDAKKCDSEHIFLRLERNKPT